MDSLPTTLIFAILIALIFLSAFFSSSETALMAVNRYKLKNLADNGHRSAALVLKLLETPDRLLGTILFGNNVANIVASTLATIIGLQMYGDEGLAFAPFILVFVVLIFAEVAPKTLAATHPERIAFPACWVLAFLQIVLYPCVWLVKLLSNGVLKLLRIKPQNQNNALSSEELQTAVKESSAKLDESHQSILLRVLEMESIKIEDVMVPRMDIVGVDLEDSWNEVSQQLTSLKYTHIPVYRGSLDTFIGIADIKELLCLFQSNQFNRPAFESIVREPYFVPENASLSHALSHLREQSHQFAMVVDEYGDIKGLITLEQILEEIIGKFSSILPGIEEEIRLTNDTTYLVRGNTSLRDINRKLSWKLPTDTATTVNGLVFEILEDIPVAGTSLKLNNYVFEILEVDDKRVLSAKIFHWQKSAKNAI